MDPTDEELVGAFQRGDSSAFDLLLGRWEGKIRGAIYRITGSDEDSRDIAQEAFLRAYRALSGFRGEARFSSWLYQIALNLCRDRMRQRKGRTLVSLEALAEEGGRLPQSPTTGPFERVEACDLSRAVAEAVAALPDEQREVIVLKEYQELTFVEIARVLQLPVSTVKTRLYRGLVLLRQKLERQGIRGAAPVPASLP